MTSPAPIQDKAPKPPGLLPKNVQSWLLMSLALLMVLIMWATGGKKPGAPPRALPSGPAVQAPLEVNEAKIVEMQKRIQDLQRQQNAAETALAQQTRALAGAEPQTGPGGIGNGAAPPERAEDAIRAERKKREYLSLFASNVALSYRKNSVPPSTHETESNPPAAPLPLQSSAGQFAELLKSLQPPAPPAASAPSRQESAAESDQKEQPTKPAVAPATET
jgi:hypothetical protein